MNKLKKYTNWFLFNFILCLAPIFILWLIVYELDGIVFSSFIAYSYTLIFISLFFYDKFKTRDDVLFWISIAFSLVLLVLFTLYPDTINEEFKIIIKNNIGFISLIVLVIIFSLSLRLYKPIVDEELKEEQSKSEFKKAQKTATKSEKMLKDLEGEDL